MSTLGERIRAHRNKLGLTQEEYAAAFGVEFYNVSSWERDKSEPDAAYFEKVAAKWPVDLSKLLGTEHAVRGINESAIPYGVSSETIELAVALSKAVHLRDAVKAALKEDSKFITRAEGLAEAMGIELDAAALVLLMKKRKEKS